jgi:predicted mannosyl-3-phosphoglycerate phosphatase (HAD superfamily)
MEIDIDYKEAKDFEKSAFVVSLKEFRELETKLKEKEDFIKRAFEDWANDDIKIEQLVEPIIGRKFIDGDSYCVPGTVGCVEELVKKYNELNEELNRLKEIMKLNFMSDIPTNEKLLIQRTELLAIAEEMAEVIIGNGATITDALPIDKLDEFYKKWNIGEPFVRDYSA